MARIPMGSFSMVVPQPAPVVRSDPEAFGAGIGQTLHTAGTIGMNMAGQEIAAGQAEELRLQRQAAAERARAANQAKDAADRVMTVRALNTVQNDARDLGDEVARGIADGSIKPEEATRHYDSKAAKLVDQRLQGVPPDLAEYVKAQAITPLGVGRNRVQDGVVAHQRQRLKSEIVLTTEELERSALVDRPRAVEVFATMMRTRGPQAGLSPDKIESSIATFRERAAFNSANQVIRGARETPEDLDAAGARLHSGEFADLSPERLGQLENQILGRRQLLESRRQTAIVRAEAATARRERQAESAARSLRDFIDGGAVPDDAYTRQVAAATAGTIYATEVRELLTGAARTAGFAQLPPAGQERAIVEMRQKLNEQGSNPALERRISRYETIAAQSKKQLADDPLMYGVKTRLVEIEPLQFGSVDELAQKIGQRAEAANTVYARTGVPTSPLLASEAHRAGEMLRALPLAQKNQVVRQLAATMDPTMIAALGRQIDGKDNVLGLALFAAGSMPPVVSELILQGADATAAGRVKDDAISNNAAAQIARDLDKVPWPTTSARDSAVAAAQRVYAGLRDRNGSANASEAVRHVTNGLADWNGAKVPMPRGYDERRFRREIEALDPKTMAKFAGSFDVVVGGQLMGVETITSNMGAMTLIPVGSGSYALASGGQMVMKRGGGVLRIEIGGK